MAEFIDFEAEANDDTLSDEIDEMEVDNPTLIDDSDEQLNNDATFYRFFNQTRNPAQVMREISDEEQSLAERMTPSNYNEYNEEEYEVDEFENSENFKQVFIQTLKNPEPAQTKENRFYSALLFAIRFIKTEKADYCQLDEINTVIGEDLHSKLESKKDLYVLNLSKRDFDQMCFELNEVLNKSNMFLRFYELKDKSRYLFHEQKQKKEVIRKISACIKNKFNGFTMTLSNSREIEKTDFFPVDIIYKPVRSPGDVIECFFSTNIRFAYGGTHSDLRSVNNLGHSKPYECYYCNHFFASKRKFDKHFRSCSSKPGVVYDFNIQNVVTFEDNLS